MRTRSVWLGCSVWLAALLLAAAACRRADAALTARVWSNTALAPDGNASTRGIADATLVELQPLLSAPFASVRLSALITPPVSDELNFTLRCDAGGSARLWIDDHLLVAGGSSSACNGSAGAGAFQRLRVLGGVPLTARLEYVHTPAPGSPAPALSVWWAGAATPSAPVPPSAWAVDGSAGAASRAALRDRLVSPAVAWQTYHRASAGAHVLAPTGFFVDTGLADTTGGGALLSNPYVVGREGAYLARAGPHSRNGSDYTQFAVWAWRGLDCNVSWETTVLARTQLLHLATASGGDCARLALVISAGMQEERAGFPAPAPAGGGFTASLPGFPDVEVVPSGAAPQPLNGSAAPPGVYFALPLADGAVVGYCAAPAPAPACPPVASARAAIDAARARAAAASARYGALADVYDAIATGVLWTTIATPLEPVGVVAIVSRSPNWAQFGFDYVCFNWDTYLIAFQASIEPGVLRDIALSTLIAITQARTANGGFVPNWKAGAHATFDRTENQVGSVITRLILERAGADEPWVLPLLFPSLLSWNEWVASSRIAAGGALPAGTSVYTQGSDPWVWADINAPPDHAMGNMQGARYESMDNSPLYATPPVIFNATTHRMELYDVSPTALLAADCDALIALAPAAGRADAVPALAARLNATAAALNAHLWLDSAGMFANRLYNGSFYARFAPPSFWPLLSGAVSDARAAALAVPLASPLGFCANASHVPGGAVGVTAPLVRWGRGSTSAACVSVDCTRAALDGRALDFIAVEASVVALGAQPPGGAAAALALTTYISAAQGNRTALSTAPPDASFAPLRQEAWCLRAPPPPPFDSWPLTNLTLWRAGAAGDVRTCGSAACEAASAGDGYTQLGAPLCLAWDASTPATLPCIVPVPSLARADAAFPQQDYWTGRAWAPHTMLVYLALRRYDHVPALRAASIDIAAMGARVLLSAWQSYGHLGENYNAYIGVVTDSGDADAFYVWCGSFGMPALIEAGF